jgi:CHAT domain-containing protein
MMRGAYSESLRLLEEPLPTALLRTDTEVQQKMVQGLDFNYLQQLDAADLELAGAETLATAVNSSLRGSVAQARGILEIERKNYEKAAASFRLAAAVAREQNRPAAELNALGNLGNVAMWQEHYDEAIDRFRAALEHSRALGAIGQESKSLGNLGWSHWVIGDFESAAADLAMAEQKAAQAGLPEDQTYWLIALADVEGLQHRFAEAEATGRRALALAETHDDKNTLVTCLQVLARNALSMDRQDDAEILNKRAAEIADSTHNISASTYSQLLAGRIAAAKGDYPDAKAAFERVLADPKTETRLKWEAHTRLAEVYAAQNLASQAEQEFNIAIRSVQAARDSIHSNELRVSFLSSAIEFYDAYIGTLIDRHRPLDALKVADLSRSQTLEQALPASNASQSKSRNSFDPQSTARRLNATLLFYWLGRERSWLWVIAPHKTSLIALPSNQEIDALGKSYRESFTGPHDPLEAKNAEGQKLYSLLVQPAEKLIPRNSRVIILPDGSLNSLNFETLIVGDPQPHYWIDDVTLWTANSLSLLGRASRSSKPRQANLLLVGDALPASPDFPPLPQAGKEIGLLEKYFEPAARLELTGKNATPAAVLSSHPERFSYLHFATHGTASRLRPLESAIILSPQGDSCNTP